LVYPSKENGFFIFPGLIHNTMDYNHHTWPSPRAKVVAKNMRLDYDPDGNKIKRLKHEDAVRLLAMKARMTVQGFLELPKEESWKALGCFRTTCYGPRVYDPLYLHSRYFNRY
jgi:hypothetical protein